MHYNTSPLLTVFTYVYKSYAVYLNILKQWKLFYLGSTYVNRPSVPTLATNSFSGADIALRGVESPKCCSLATATRQAPVSSLSTSRVCLSVGVRSLQPRKHTKGVQLIRIFQYKIYFSVHQRTICTPVTLLMMIDLALGSQRRLNFLSLRLIVIKVVGCCSTDNYSVIRQELNLLFPNPLN